MNSSAVDLSPVRFGILGTARIADKIAAGIREAHGIELTAVASRDAERAQAWAAKHSIPQAFGSYQALLDCPEIDAVYIPLPPTLHAEWTIKAAQCGKHVLCEKPLAASIQQAQEMAAACTEHGVQLMDGVMWLHHDRTAAMHRVIQSGTLGPLRRMTAAFSFNANDFEPGDIRFQRELAGGVLGDLGWYCVGATLWAFGNLPERVFANSRFQNDVDMNTSAILWFAENRMASFDCGFDTTMRKWFELAGTEGSIVCDDFTNPWNADQARFWVHADRGKADQQTFAGCNQIVRMLERFAAAVQSGRLEPEWPAASLATQRVCDALARSARETRIIEL